MTMKENFYNLVKNKKWPYVIAEIGSNHNGDMDLAKRLIVAAKESGADCVKFQSWSKDSIFSKTVYKLNFFLNDDYRNRTDFTLEQIVEKFSISEKQLLEMKSFCDDIGIDCTSTPFSFSEVDFVVDALKTPFIKVASMDVNNYPFLDYIGRKNLPIVLSTGLSELHEIDKAIRTIENAGNEEIIILHCVAIYPPKDEEVNLRNIETLRQLYPYPVGYSDHSIGFEVPLAAAAMGSVVIEKHFTLDTEMFGWDHKVSATPEILKAICHGSRRISNCLGSHRISCEESEERKAAFRRSLVLKGQIKAGGRIRLEDLDFKRPGTGISPGDLQKVVGRRVNRDLDADQILEWGFLD